MHHRPFVVALGAVLASVVLAGCHQPTTRSSSPALGSEPSTSTEILSVARLQDCTKGVPTATKGSFIRRISFTNDGRSYRVAAGSTIEVTQSPDSPIANRLSVRPSGSLCALGSVTGSVGNEHVLLDVRRVGPIELFDRAPPIEPAPTDMVLKFAAS